MELRSYQAQLDDCPFDFADSPLALPGIDAGKSDELTRILADD